MPSAKEKPSVTTARFHITSTGKVAVCKATVKPCPLGGQHFGTAQEAQNVALLKSQAITQAQKKQAPVNPTAKRLTAMKTVDAETIKEILNDFNTSGDMFFKPGTLQFRTGNYSTGTFIGAEDNTLYDFHVKAGDFIMVYKSYENEDEEEVLTEARPYVRKMFNQLDLEDVYAKPDEEDWESEVLAANMSAMFEQAQNKHTNWNKDTNAVTFMYFGEAFEDINQSLRNGTHFNPDFIQTLDKVIEKDTLTEPTVVYRGIRTTSDQMEQQIMTQGYKDPGYLSTSADSKVGQGFAGGNNHRGLLMKLTLPAGTKCSKETTSHEQEITLPRNYDLSNAEWTLLGDR